MISKRAAPARLHGGLKVARSAFCHCQGAFCRGCPRLSGSTGWDPVACVSREVSKKGGCR